MSADAAAPEIGALETPAPAGKRLRRFLALGILVVGFGVILTLWAPALPRDHVLVFEGRDAPIQELELSWVEHAEHAETLGTVKLRPERARRRLSYVLRAANGNYELSIRAVLVEDGAATDAAARLRETSVVRQVTLSGNDTLIPLRSTE